MKKRTRFDVHTSDKETLTLTLPRQDAWKVRFMLHNPFILWIQVKLNHGKTIRLNKRQITSYTFQDVF